MYYHACICMYTHRRSWLVLGFVITIIMANVVLIKVGIELMQDNKRAIYSPRNTIPYHGILQQHTPRSVGCWVLHSLFLVNLVSPQ